jgi:hypothetical protein
MLLIQSTDKRRFFCLSLIFLFSQTRNFPSTANLHPGRVSLRYPSKCGYLAPGTLNVSLGGLNITMITNFELFVLSVRRNRVALRLLEKE